jgi:hypothetical protein
MEPTRKAFKPGNCQHWRSSFSQLAIPASTVVVNSWVELRILVTQERFPTFGRTKFPIPLSPVFELANNERAFFEIHADGSTEMDVVLTENASFCSYSHAKPCTPSFLFVHSFYTLKYFPS